MDFVKKMTRYAVIVKAVAGMEMVVILTLLFFRLLQGKRGFLKREKTVIFFFKLGRAIFRIEALMHNALDNMIVITSKK